ncbi:MAG: NTP transferase domain-containing protein [Acidobacteriota bacterium]
MIPLAILAGGYGRRLGTIGRRVPKSLVPVRGACFLDYQLAWAVRQGVNRVVLCLGHRGREIRRHLERRPPHGVSLWISDEGARPRGTAAALRLALEQLGKRFFVLYGDSYLPVCYAAVEFAQRASGSPALMVIYRNDGRYGRSNVQPRSKTIVRYMRGDLPGLCWIDAGLSVLTPAALGAHATPDLPVLFEALALSGRLACRRTRQRFYEVGSSAGLAEFRRWAPRLRDPAGW